MAQQKTWTNHWKPREIADKINSPTGVIRYSLKNMYVINKCKKNLYGYMWTLSRELENIRRKKWAFHNWKIFELKLRTNKCNSKWGTAAKRFGGMREESKK